MPALRKLASSAADVRTRLKALWVLDGLDAIEPTDVMPALSHADRDVRVSALRLSERWLRMPNHPIQGAVMKLLDDTDWAVRRQLAATLGELPAGSKEAAIASVLERHGDDPIAVDAALSGSRGSELAVLDRLLQPAVETSPRSTAITMLAATIVRVGEDAPIQTLMQRVADTSRVNWQRFALLRGAEVALLACDDAGQPEPRRAAIRMRRVRRVPADAVDPVARARFQARSKRRILRHHRRVRAARPSRSPASPRSIAVAAEKGELGDRAAKVMARIGWPGKAGAAPAAAALSAADQKRFTAGQEIYKNICEGCHGADGREQPGATPNIAGAPSVIGAPGVPIRVLLHGKEGAIGLMPAHGDSAERYGDRRGAHLHPPRVGTNRRADRCLLPCSRCARQPPAARAHGRRKNWRRSSETCSCTKQKDVATIAERPKAARHRSRGWAPNAGAAWGPRAPRQTK